MKQNCNVPAFLSKLWTLVEDHSTSDLICWSQDGCSFIVCEEQRFCKEILPLYFKHSNMTSFVRQLNMYGFRKVLQVEAGLLRAEGRGGGGVEFQHPYFRRTQPNLLELIRRKVSVSRAGEEGVSPVSRVLLDLGQVRGWQDGSDCKLMALCRSETCDPLTLIDTGLAALNPALNPPLTPSPGSSLDLLTELFNPQPCSPGGDSQTETLKGRSGMGDWARKRTASQTVATFDWGSQRRGQSEDEEGEEGSDILPCLLRLAQEASDFAYSPVGACPEMVQFDLNCLQEQ
uniref:Heat shock factor protein 1-like n=1 Tax=Paramormyrops kingsleyae TaxID=1676925 RepID=A0A3B3R8A3_9TELE